MYYSYPFPTSRPTPDAQTLDAFIRLNGFVRSNSFDSLWGCRLRRAIYGYKTILLFHYFNCNQLQVRPVAIKTRCRDCGGSGRYTDNYDRLHDHCWLCDSTGAATLNFFESTLPNGHIFHTPERYASSMLFKAATPPDVLPGFVFRDCPIIENWTVNQPGGNLTPTELAEALNAVEAWAWGECFPEAYEILSDAWEQEFFYYKFPLGNLGADTQHCSFCGAKRKIGTWQHTPLLHWHIVLCEAHDFTDNHPQAWPKDPPPAALITPPIQAWLDRRNTWYKTGDIVPPVEF